MANFPTPFAGQAALYPVTAAKRYPVMIVQFDDGTEQRYRQSAAVSRFNLVLGQITKEEKDAIVSFFNDCKGSFDATWNLVLGADTYNHMAFASDEIKPVEQSNGMWSLNVSLVQTRKN